MQVWIKQILKEREIEERNLKVWITWDILWLHIVEFNKPYIFRIVWEQPQTFDFHYLKEWDVLCKKQFWHECKFCSKNIELNKKSTFNVYEFETKRCKQMILKPFLVQQIANLYKQNAKWKFDISIEKKKWDKVYYEVKAIPRVLQKDFELWYIPNKKLLEKLLMITENKENTI